MITFWNCQDRAYHSNHVWGYLDPIPIKRVKNLIAFTHISKCHTFLQVRQSEQRDQHNRFFCSKLWFWNSISLIWFPSLFLISGWDQLTILIIIYLLKHFEYKRKRICVANDQIKVFSWYIDIEMFLGNNSQFVDYLIL